MTATAASLPGDPEAPLSLTGNAQRDSTLNGLTVCVSDGCRTYESFCLCLFFFFFGVACLFFKVACLYHVCGATLVCLCPLILGNCLFNVSEQGGNL